MNRNVVTGGVVLLAVVIGVVVIGAVVAGAERQRDFVASSYEVVTAEGSVEGSECPVAEVNITGSGEGVLLGKFTVVRTHCFTPPDHPAFAGEVMHDGTYEITAESGDKIWGTYVGALEPTDFGEAGPIRGIITSPSTIDGGSGKFANASGEYMAIGDYDLVADEGEFEFEGWIQY